MIDLTYPQNIEDWKRLIASVEDQSDYQILSGMAGIPEIVEIAARLMTSAAREGLVTATERYLNDIANICMEDEQIGKDLYLFFTKQIQELNLAYVNYDVQDLLNNITMRELNNSYKRDTETRESDSIQILKGKVDEREALNGIIGAKLTTDVGEEFIMKEDEDGNIFFDSEHYKVKPIIQQNDYDER